MMTRLSTFILPLALVFCASCTSIDEERSALRGTLTSANVLAQEVSGWTSELRTATKIPQTASATMRSFQDRAAELSDQIDGISSEAKVGFDTTAIMQALAELEDFNASELDDASQSARNALLAQFDRLSVNVQQAAMSLRSRSK